MKSKLSASILVISITILVILLITLAVVITAPRTSDSDSSSSSSETSSSISSSTSSATSIDPNTLWDAYLYAGAKGDGTIALFDNNGKEISLSLEEKGWKKLSWSKDGRSLAMLALSTEGTEVYDIYTYSMDTKTLEQRTDFAPTGSGVSNYFWLDNDTLIFDKVTSGSNWLHRYDIESNQLTKLFILSGNLWRLASSDEVAIVTASDMGDGDTGKDFYLQSLSGDTLARIWGYKIAGQTWVLDVIPDSLGSSYFINALSLYEEDSYAPHYAQYVWKLDEPTYTEIPMWSDKESYIVCEYEDKYVGIEQDLEDLSIYLLTMSNSEGANNGMVIIDKEELATLAKAWRDHLVCTDDSILVPVQMESGLSWQEIHLNGGMTSELATAGRFFEVVKR